MGAERPVRTRVECRKKVHGKARKEEPRRSVSHVSLKCSLASEPFHCDPRHPAVYQRTKDVQAGVYWINTSRPLAEKILTDYKADSTRWREYLFQRYVDII